MAAPPITERHQPHFHRKAPFLEHARVATTANITLSGTQTIDGVAVVAGNRVLVKNQSTASGNGLYLCASGAWTRDYDLSTDDPSFAFLIFVSEGSTNAATIWKNTNTAAPTIGSTSLTFTQVAAAGFSDPMTTRGDIIVRNASNVTARLGIGSNTQVLQSDGTDISWQTPSSGFTNPMTTKGDIITGDTGGTATRLGAGTSAYVLTSNGAAAFPSWQANAGGSGGIPQGKLPVNSATQNGSTSTNSLALTVTAPTNGNLLILVSCRDDNGTISSVTQTNVTWTQVATATAAPRVEVWKGVVSASAGTSITVAYSSTSFSQYVVTEWNGITGTLDQSAVNSGVTTLGAFCRTPSLLPTQTNALVIGGMATTNNSTTYNPGVSGNLRTPDCMTANTMRMMCVFGFPGQTYCHAISLQNNSSTQSGVLVSLT